MQAYDYNDRLIGNPKPFNPVKLEAMLNDTEKKIKGVRVFRLKKGMTLDIGGVDYKVIAVRENGKVTMRLK